jgi:hypothetical protein
MNDTWQPTINDEVEHRVTGRVGRVRLRNNAVDDEVLVTWARGAETWETVSHLRPLELG